MSLNSQTGALPACAEVEARHAASIRSAPHSGANSSSRIGPSFQRIDELGRAGTERLAALLYAQGVQQFDRGGIAPKDFSSKPLDPFFPGVTGQMSDEESAQTATLPVIPRDERNGRK